MECRGSCSVTRKSNEDVAIDRAGGRQLTVVSCGEEEDFTTEDTESAEEEEELEGGEAESEEKRA